MIDSVVRTDTDALLRAGVARDTGMPAGLPRAAVAFLATLVDDTCSPA